MDWFLASLLFLIGVYWPYLAVAAVIGMVTGWLSLGRQNEIGQ